jgi:dihydroneopterin aldolase
VTVFQALSVFVRGLCVEARIGLYPHERISAQSLVIDVELRLRPGSIASLEQTVDYDMVASSARALAADAHIDLVENFAETLARACLDHPRVTSARVRVEKSSALNGAEGAGAEVLLCA